MTSTLGRDIASLLEKETGPMGVFILNKQCGLLSIAPDEISEEHLPKLALKLSEALLVFGKDKANRVYVGVKRLSRASASSDASSNLERELDMAQAAGNVGNLAEEKEHLSRANVLGAAKHPVLAGRFHCIRGAFLLREGELDTAMNEYDEALSFFQGRGDGAGEIDAVLGRGSVLWRMGRYAEAKETLTRCAELCRKRDDGLMEGRCLVALGNIHDEWGKFDEAIRYSEMAKKAFELVGEEKGMATLHNNLGVAYARRGMYRESLAEYEKCIALSNKIGYMMMEGWAMFNAAEDSARLGRFEEALEMCKRSEDVFLELGDKLGISGVHMSYAVTYWLQKNPEKAEEHFSKTLDIRRSLGMPYRLADALYEYGMFLSSIKGLDDAREAFLESREIFRGLSNQERTEQIDKALADLKQGNVGE